MSRAWGTLKVADEFKSNLRDAAASEADEAPSTPASGREGERLDRPSKSTVRSSSWRLWRRGSREEFFVAMWAWKSMVSTSRYRSTVNAMTNRHPPKSWKHPQELDRRRQVVGKAESYTQSRGRSLRRRGPKVRLSALFNLSLPLVPGPPPEVAEVNGTDRSGSSVVHRSRSRWRGPTSL